MFMEPSRNSTLCQPPSRGTPRECPCQAPEPDSAPRLHSEDG